jgi:hypothetical protein
MTNFFKGAATGILSLFGMGDLYNELGKASSELKSIQSKTNELTTLNSLSFSENTVDQIKKLLQLKEKIISELNLEVIFDRLPFHPFDTNDIDRL